MTLSAYAASVTAAEIEAHPNVVAALAALAQAEAAHAEAARVFARYDNLPAAIAENEKRARAELDGLRDRLAAVCAGILTGTSTEAEEVSALAAIAEAERVVQRCVLGRPQVEKNINASQRHLGSMAVAIERRQEELESARAAAREDIARERI